MLSGDEHVEEYTAPDNVISSDRNDLAEMLTTGEVDAVIGAGPIDSEGTVPLFANSNELALNIFLATTTFIDTCNDHRCMSLCTFRLISDRATMYSYTHI